MLSQIRTFLQPRRSHEVLSIFSILMLCLNDTGTFKFYLRAPKVYKLSNSGKHVISELTIQWLSFFNHHLQPFDQVPPFLYQRYNLVVSILHSMSHPLSLDKILLSVNVKSLWIPHAHGLAAPEHFLNTRLNSHKSCTHLFCSS